MWTQLFQMLQIFFSCFIGYRNNLLPAVFDGGRKTRCLTTHGERRRWSAADLIEHNLRLVAPIVKQFDIRRKQTEDLISIGTIGLIKEIEKLEKTKSFWIESRKLYKIWHFSTYNMKNIRKAILVKLAHVLPFFADAMTASSNSTFWSDGQFCFLIYWFLRGYQLLVLPIHAFPVLF